LFMFREHLLQFSRKPLEVYMANSRCMALVFFARSAAWCMALFLATLQAHAQHPVLAPTTDVSITVTGPVRYSAVNIPQGVTVRFVAPLAPWFIPSPPAVILCDGDAIIRGTISVAGDVGDFPPYTYPPGFVTLGQGGNGLICLSVQPAEGGRHAGSYGTVIPFSLEGGSRGGDMDIYDQFCWNYVRTRGGGFGGGTLVLLAGGSIDVHGTITADGIQFGESGTGAQDFAGGGSGGSILLRSASAVTVFPTGRVTARGGSAQGSPAVSIGAPGYVRIDAYANPPRLQGTVAPTPTVLELPHLHRESPPQIGTTWSVNALAPENSPVFVSAALQPAPGTPTPFGPLGIHLPLSFTLAMLVTQPGHDPIASLPLPIPNSQGLRGQSLWLQALAVPPNLPPRLTNTLAVIVQ